MDCNRTSGAGIGRMGSIRTVGATVPEHSGATEVRPRPQRWWEWVGWGVSIGVLSLLTSGFVELAEWVDRLLK